MAARTSMQYIVDQVRLMISDPAGVSSRYSDEQIQDALDDNRLDVEDEPLESRMDNTQFLATEGWWEANAVLSDESGTVSPTSSNWRRGAWSFLVAHSSPLTITGSVYDVYGAAADMLDLWVSSMAMEVEQFTADGLTVKRGGRSNLQTLASQYRMRSKGYKNAGGLSVALWVRTDVNPWS